MSTKRELIKADFSNELSDGKGLVIFDMGCYFPYSNQDILTFDFSLGMKEMKYKRNHRYPNNGYVTLSKKMGRRVCKYGYPEIVDIDTTSPIILNVEFGIKSEVGRMLFPVFANVTAEKPVCGMSFHFMFDDGIFRITTYDKSAEGVGWIEKTYSNKAVSDDTIEAYEKGLYVPMFGRLSAMKNTVIYEDAIELFPSKIEEFL